MVVVWVMKLVIWDGMIRSLEGIDMFGGDERSGGRGGNGEWVG